MSLSLAAPGYYEFGQVSNIDDSAARLRDDFDVRLVHAAKLAHNGQEQLRSDEGVIAGIGMLAAASTEVADLSPCPETTFDFAHYASVVLVSRAVSDLADGTPLRQTAITADTLRPHLALAAQSMRPFVSCPEMAPKVIEVAAAGIVTEGLLSGGSGDFRGWFKAGQLAARGADPAAATLNLRHITGVLLNRPPNRSEYTSRSHAHASGILGKLSLTPPNLSSYTRQQTA